MIQEADAMGIIRQLPPAVVNQIAAGEVVERPASVVKELLENALDAQATRIDLTVERGGKDLVRVADNGVGMSPDDLVLAFRPHATSKLADVDDLHRVRTLGFRGEALAAIAEVAKVRCQTRQAGASEGAELTIEGGVFGPVKSCGCPPGTVIEVRNLFFNHSVRQPHQVGSDQAACGRRRHSSSGLAGVAGARPPRTRMTASRPARTRAARPANRLAGSLTAESQRSQRKSESDGGKGTQSGGSRPLSAPSAGPTSSRPSPPRWAL
jgi:hypothetical protein